MRGFRGLRIRPQKLLLKGLWSMIRTPGAITMGIIMARAIIMDIMVMKAATAITVKDMSADTTMAKGSTVAIKRETKDAVTITANKRGSSPILFICIFAVGIATLGLKKHNINNLEAIDSSVGISRRYCFFVLRGCFLIKKEFF